MRYVLLFVDTNKLAGDQDAIGPAPEYRRVDVGSRSLDTGPPNIPALRLTR